MIVHACVGKSKAPHPAATGHCAATVFGTPLCKQKRHQTKAAAAAAEAAAAAAALCTEV